MATSLLTPSWTSQVVLEPKVLVIIKLEIVVETATIIEAEIREKVVTGGELA